MNMKQVALTSFALNLILAIFLFSDMDKSIGQQPDSQATPVTYEQFTMQADRIIGDLSQVYPVTQASPHFTIYPSNVNKQWADTKMDAVDDNVTTPKKKEIYIVDEQEQVITKVGVYFEPSLTGKHYLSVNRVDSFTNKAVGTDKQLPRLYSNSFTDNGMLIQVTTFDMKPANQQPASKSQQEQIETLMIDLNTKITTEIQKGILGM